MDNNLHGEISVTKNSRRKRPHSQSRCFSCLYFKREDGNGISNSRFLYANVAAAKSWRGANTFNCTRL
ncbi:hypothetical protein KIN20_034348 [Parelaphostrongylus tenuis]|uniref:Uncharacterized protein n=1 Tax=Parelaphostrongylus tenuis TaxID=148309 RepID=A0AAD5WJL5_PARTN|nr:hypothetical protein KIN20_034348 [Parelaphostrongylus tenuis]